MAERKQMLEEKRAGLVKKLGEVNAKVVSTQKKADDVKARIAEIDKELASLPA